jgi:hypothetical protein
MGGNARTTLANADNGKTGISADLIFSRHVLADPRFKHSRRT